MNKSDLIEQIVTRADLPRKRAEQVVNLLFDEMTEALVQNKRIEIRGFGSFVSKRYRARVGRNPRTGASIAVPAKRLPIFKVGKELRERVDFNRLEARMGSNESDATHVGHSHSDEERTGQAAAESSDS